MLKKYILLPLLWVQITAPIDPTHSTFDIVGDKINVIKSGCVITETIYDTAAAIKNSILPNAELKNHNEEVQELLTILTTEEKLQQCLVENALGPKDIDQLPSACKKFAEAFTIAAGLTALDPIKQEFIAASKEFSPIKIPDNKPSGISTTKKVLIGSTVVILGGTACVFAAPIVLPGTLIAAKATALIASAKAGVAAVGIKIAATSAATKASVVSVGKPAFDIAKNIASAGINKVYAMPITAHINLTANIIEITKECAPEVRPFIYKTNEEKLVELYNRMCSREPLNDRIRKSLAEKQAQASA